MIIISNISDHLLIMLDITVNETLKFNKEKQKFIEFCKYNEESLIHFKNELLDGNICDHLDISNNGNPNNNYNIFIQILQDCKNVHFPMKKVKFKK